MLPPRRLTTFLRTPAPAPTEMPSEKLIRVNRNFLTLSVSALSGPGEKRLKPAMPRPRLTADIPTVLGITRWVGGTGTVHTDTGVVALLELYHYVNLTHYTASDRAFNMESSSVPKTFLLSSLTNYKRLCPSVHK